MPQALRRSLSVATATAVAASALVALGGAGVANAATVPTINEFSNDIDGSNDPEFVELAADAGTPLDGYTLLVVRAGTDGNPALQGSVYRSTAITGTTDENGLLRIDLPVNHILNSTVTLMVVDGAAPATNVDLDGNDDGQLDEGLGFTIVDSVGTTSSAGFAYGDTILAPTFDGGSRYVGGASLTADGWVRNAYSGYGFPDRAYVEGDEAFALNTPGQPNRMAEVPDVEEPPVVVPEPELCGVGITPIGAVQGTTDVSPFVGQTVTVEGVVTMLQPSVRGIAIQSLTGADDADAGTSEGLFVFSDAAASQLAVGDHVRITGAVSEYFGQTQIAGTERTLCAESVTLPAPTALALPIADHEPFESMLVTLPQDLAIIEMFEFGRFGSYVLGTDRQWQPTHLYAPDAPEAQQLRDENLANRIIVDDASNVQNPTVLTHPNGQPFTIDNLFRGGDIVADATGVLNYTFDEWRLNPTQGADYTAANARPDVPDVGGDVQVAAFNVLNFFTTLGERGAVTADELQRQEAKIVAALLALDADVVGLMEIENNGTALTTLVAALNEAAGEERYAEITTGRLGTDQISTALIYQPAAVTPVGDWAALTSEEDPRFDTSLNRPALTQSFQVATGEVLTISVNHLKSKGANDRCLPLGSSLQGNCNEVRTAAADALGDWLATDPTQSGSDYAMVIGDLNSYRNEDPIVALEEDGFVDLLEAHVGDEAYSYLFDGELGYLDHSLANASLAPFVTDATTWHANADEASVIGYQTRFFQTPAQAAALYAPDAFRASDHDAVLVGIAFDAPVDPEPTAPTPTDPTSPAPTVPGDGVGGGDGTAPGASGGSLPTTGGEMTTWLLAVAAALVAAGALMGLRRARRSGSGA